MSTTIFAPVKWAQRTDELYITIDAVDCPKPDIKVTEDKLVFDAIGTDKKHYHNDLVFFAPINADDVKINSTGRQTILILTKKTAGEAYWPRLLKEKGKYFWLKTDFARWKDEDEEDDEETEANPMNNFDLSQFSNLAGGAGGMGGMGGLPDMSALAGMGGMGGMGGLPDMSALAGMGGLDFSNIPGGIPAPGYNPSVEEVDDDSKENEDDEIPALEKSE